MCFSQTTRLVFYYHLVSSVDLYIVFKGGEETQVFPSNKSFVLTGPEVTSAEMGDQL